MRRPFALCYAAFVYLLMGLLTGSGASAQVCQGGSAGGFPCNNIDLLARLPLSQIGGGNGNDLWGWTDPATGVEYAIMGRTNGTAFVSLADPLNPVFLGNLPTQDTTSSWRDIKVFANHAFIVADAQPNHGMQVFDLTQLRSVTNPPVTFSSTALYTQFGSAHNIGINEDTGFAYAVDTSTCAGGLHMININNPVNPTFAGCFSGDGSTHDVQCVIYNGPDTQHQQSEICFASNGDTLTIVDVTNKSNPQMLSRTGYSGQAFAHQGWITGDHVFFLLGDELDERNFGHNTRTYIFDISNLDAPFVTSTFTFNSPAVDHNLYIQNGFTFEANYTSGLRILRNDNPATGDFTEVAFFDTFPSADNRNFAGAWSVYPFFSSGVVTVSDIQSGLFVLMPNLTGGPPPPPPPPPADCPGGLTPLHSADFESGAGGWIQGADTCSTGSFVVGSPTEVVSSGVTTQAAGGANGTANAFFTAPNSAAGTNDVDGGTCEALSPVVDASGQSSVEIFFSYFHGQRDAGDDANDGFSIEVLSNGSVVGTPVSLGDVTNNAVWTPVSTTISSPGNLQLRVRASDGAGGGDLVEGAIDQVLICPSDAAPPPPPPPPPPPGGCTVNDDFEGGAAGWINDPASTCTTGDYVLGTPTEIVNGGVTTQVGGANSGVNALFTATNTAAGTNDVDGGNCILTSPTFSVAAASTLSVASFHGQRDAGDDPGGDFFTLEVSTNGGASFTTIASTGDATSNAAWGTTTAQVPTGSDVVLRVQCSDGAGPGDLIECGIDDFSICDN